jgi:cytidine deaminase
METIDYNSLSDEEKKLIDSAEEALTNAYNPYTKSYVAGAVLTESGEIIKGACFANESTSVNICAERSVVITANSLGHRDIKILAIIAKAENKKYKEPLTPCGICRQFLIEITKITGKDLIILSSNSDKTKIIKTSIYELMPYPYSRS